MYCPRKFNSKTLDANGSVKVTTCQCEKEECAWWIRKVGLCAYTDIALSLTAMSPPGGGQGALRYSERPRTRG